MKERLRNRSLIPNRAWCLAPLVTCLRSSRGQVAIAPTSTDSSIEIAASPPSSAEYLVRKIIRHKRVLVTTAAVVLLIMCGLVYGLIELWRHNQLRPTVPSQSMKITRLTDTGKATTAAISPDGNYVAYALENEGKQSLRLRQVTSTSESEIVGPAEVSFTGLTFSRDGNLIYYTEARKSNRRGTLYQLPTLGGTPRKVSDGGVGTA